MKRYLIKSCLTPIAFLLLPSAFAPPLRAQCGDDNLNNPATQKDYEWEDHFTAVTRLGDYYMPFFGDGDSMSQAFWLTGGANPGYGSDGFRETWYIPRDDLPGTAPFYHLYTPAALNHLDVWTSRGALVLTHGYPWTYQRAGTLPITRYLKPSIFDHRTWLHSKPPPDYNVDAILSSASGVPRYGYERFGNLLNRCQTLAAAYDTEESLATGILRVDFNRIWGNAIGRITHLASGRQIVDEDIGAMVQSTIFVSSTADDPNTCCLINPTEAGGVDPWNYGNTRRWAGSPILSSVEIGQSTRQTVVKPANFSSNVFLGTDRYSPLLWNGQFRKTVTLGYTAGATPHGDVIKMVFEAKLDSDATPAMASHYTNVGMNNTFWLWRDVISTAADLRLEEWNLTTNTKVQDIPVPPYFTSVWLCNSDLQLPCSPHRGYIAYSATDPTLAYGVMRRDNADAPHAFKIQNWCNGGDVNCSNGRPELVFDYFKNRGLSAAAYQSETAFLVVGPPATVRTRLRQIYCQETGACTP